MIPLINKEYGPYLNQANSRISKTSSEIYTKWMELPSKTMAKNHKVFLKKPKQIRVKLHENQ